MFRKLMERLRGRRNTLYLVELYEEADTRIPEVRIKDLVAA
ncbi:MAG: hypothetical protein R3343_11905 [Nitriliruptorales bacterium]|nr:hypothetical protein [Nitriliruptorales bacterium]